jgi:hypothetical protein
VIHGCDDEDAVAILRNVRRAIRPDGRLLVIETPLERGATGPGSFMDLLMLLLGGRERTEAEYRALLAQAGFELERTIPTGAGSSILEGRPV